MKYNKIKWYHYLYSVGTLTAFSFGLFAQQIINKEINTEIDVGLSELYQLQSNYIELEKERDELKIQNSIIDSELIKYKTEYYETKNKLTIITKEHDNMSDLIKELTEETQSLQEQLTTQQHLTNEYKKELDKREVQSIKLISENKDIVALEATYSRRVKDLTILNETLEKSVNALQSQVNYLSKENENKNQSIIGLRDFRERETLRANTCHDMADIHSSTIVYYRELMPIYQDYLQSTILYETAISRTNLLKERYEEIGISIIDLRYTNINKKTVY
jgi:chromosome segregation ATPase